MRRNHHRSRNPLFAKRWFADDTIIRCVHWYLRFKLSYRDLAQIMGELGIRVAPCTILRWVIRYSVDLCRGLASLRARRGPIMALRRNVYQGCRAMDVFVPRRRCMRQNGGIASEPYAGHRSREGVLPQSTQATWTTADHHTRRFRGDPFGIAPDGDAERVQFP